MHEAEQETVAQAHTRQGVHAALSRRLLESLCSGQRQPWEPGKCSSSLWCPACDTMVLQTAPGLAQLGASLSHQVQQGSSPAAYSPRHGQGLGRAPWVTRTALWTAQTMEGMGWDTSQTGFRYEGRLCDGQ